MYLKGSDGRLYQTATVVVSRPKLVSTTKDVNLAREYHRYRHDEYYV